MCIAEPLIQPYLSYRDMSTGSMQLNPVVAQQTSYRSKTRSSINLLCSWLCSCYSFFHQSNELWSIFCLGKSVDFIGLWVYFMARGLQNYKIGFQSFWISFSPSEIPVRISYVPSKLHFLEIIIQHELRHWTTGPFSCSNTNRLQFLFWPFKESWAKETRNLLHNFTAESL